MDDATRALSMATLLAERMWRRRDRKHRATQEDTEAVLTQIFDEETGGVSGGSIPPLDGDVTGPIGGNTVVGLRGRSLSGATPADGDIYVWDATLALWVPGSAGGTAITLEDEGGAPLTPRSVVNIVGPIVQATDDAPNNRINVTITDPVPAHEALADPHTGYQKESEKNSANGYAGLGADGLVPQDHLGGGIQDGTRFLRDDGVWGQLTTSDPALSTVLSNPMVAGGDMITGALASTLANAALSTAGATATASSGASPTNAIDGNDATAWVAGAGNSTQWLAVDLGASKVVTHWRLLQNAGFNANRANAYVIQSSVDGGSWVTQASLTGQTVVPDTGTVPLAASVNARYWRIFASPTGLDPWTIHTLQFYSSGAGQPQRLPGGTKPGQALTWGSDGLPTWATISAGGGGGAGLTAGQTVQDYRNVALMAIQGTVASASSIGAGFYQPNPAEDPFDGWDNSWWIAGTNAAGQWVKIDLGAPKDISAVRLYIQNQYEFSVSASRLQSSTDNAAWTDRLSLGAFHDTGIIALPGGPITARYWRWYADAATGYPWTAPSLTSFELLEADGHIRELVNEAVAFIGASAISTGAYVNNPPSYAIDNDDGTYWWSDAVDAVNRNVRVDLGSAKEIVGFRFLNRDPRISGAWTSKLQSSTDDTNWTDRHTLGRFGESGQIPLNSGPVTARYWRWVTLTGPTPRIDSLELLSGSFDVGTAGGGGSGPIIVDETADLPSRARLRFQGTGVTATDNSADDAIDVAIPGGMTVREIDGTPSVDATVLEVTNGKLTDQGAGVARLDLSAAGVALTVEESDGTPTGTPDTLKFPNGTLTDNGDGSFTYTPAGGGGGGGGIDSGIYSARPAAGNADAAYIATDDGDRLYVDDGSAWMGFGPIRQLVKPPAVSAWTQVNFAGCTATDHHDAVDMVIPVNAGTNLRCLVKAAPSTPYKISAAFLVNLWRVDSNSVHLLRRNSSTGTITSVNYGTSSGYSGFRGCGVNYYNTASSYNTTTTAPALTNHPTPMWLQIEDDGTTVYYRISMDGRNWILVYSVGRTTFHTPDQVGWALDASNGSFAPMGSLISWKQE